MKTNTIPNESAHIENFRNNLPQNSRLDHLDGTLIFTEKNSISFKKQYQFPNSMEHDSSVSCSIFELKEVIKDLRKSPSADNSIKEKNSIRDKIKGDPNYSSVQISLNEESSYQKVNTDYITKKSETSINNREKEVNVSRREKTQVEQIGPPESAPKRKEREEVSCSCVVF